MRYKIGATQEQFARYFSLSPAHIAMIDSTQRNFPKAAKSKLSQFIQWLTAAEAMQPSPPLIVKGEVELLKRHLDRVATDCSIAGSEKTGLLWKKKKKFKDTSIALRNLENMKLLKEHHSEMPDPNWLNELVFAQQKARVKNDLIQQAQLIVRIAGLKAEREAALILLERIKTANAFSLDLMQVDENG